MHLKPIPTTIHSDMVPHARDQTQDTADADTQEMRPARRPTGGERWTAEKRRPRPAKKRKRRACHPTFSPFWN